MLSHSKTFIVFLAVLCNVVFAIPADMNEPLSKLGHNKTEASATANGELTCQPGCEQRPTKEQAMEICKANSKPIPSASDAIKKYYCESDDFSAEDLQKHMCLCTGRQYSQQEGGVCSNNCNDWGCCDAGDVCISSHVVNSRWNHCFKQRLP